MKIKSVKYSHIGGRAENEDSVVCRVLSDSAVYAVVADGVGGHGDGSVASRIAVKCFSQCERCAALPSEAQILQWFQEANQEILAKNRTAAGMRTTAVFLAVYHNCATWAHIGDSRLYHFHNDHLEDYTKDHSVAQVQVFAGELTREQIPFSQDRSKILRALGDETAEAEIHQALYLQPGRHAFLLCTDGFWEYLTDTEICLDLMKSESPEIWLGYLRCRGDLRKNMDADNNSAVAVFIDV